MPQLMRSTFGGAPEPLEDCSPLVVVKDEPQRTCLPQLLAAVTVLHCTVPELALNDASPLFPKRLRVRVAGEFPSGKHLKYSARLLRLLAKKPHCFLMKCKASQVVPKMRAHGVSARAAFTALRRPPLRLSEKLACIGRQVCH